jgi:hypothetical protein
MATAEDRGVHVEEIDSILDVVLDEHPPGIAANELSRCLAQVVGQQEGGFFVTQVGDGQLANGAVVIAEDNAIVQNARMLVLACDAVQFDARPGSWGRVDHGTQQPGAASAQGDETDPLLVQFVQVGVGRQFGIENEFFG